MISSVSEFLRLRLSYDIADQARATHEAVSEEEIWHVLMVQHPDLKIWIVRNKTVPLSILRILATDVNPDVRREVAGKRKLDAAIFAVLATDNDERVRAALMSNPKCPVALKETLRQA
jgi:hypothetical protein